MSWKIPTNTPPRWTGRHSTNTRKKPTVRKIPTITTTISSKRTGRTAQVPMATGRTRSATQTKGKPAGRINGCARNSSKFRASFDTLRFPFKWITPFLTAQRVSLAINKDVTIAEKAAPCGAALESQKCQLGREPNSSSRWLKADQSRNSEIDLELHFK